MSKLLKYIRYSNLNISFSLNPFIWKIEAYHEGPSSLDPKMHFFCLQLLAFRIVLVIDDGTY